MLKKDREPTIKLLSLLLTLLLVTVPVFAFAIEPQPNALPEAESKSASTTAQTSQSGGTESPSQPAASNESDAQSETSESQTDAQAEPESTFDLLELRVKGNTKLEDTVIERSVYPFLGPKMTIDTVISAQKALEDVYKNKGYQTVTVDIPEQDVENGVVYLQVIEGKVSRLRVTDSRYFSLGKIKSGVPEVAEGNVPNLPVMQKQLEELSSQSPDRKITPILRAGDTPGTLEVDLKVKDEMPLHGRIELNGRNTSSTSRLRLVTSLHYDNLWQRLHSASLTYQVSPENNQEVDVWAGTYAMPIPETDAKLAFYAVSSSSNAQVASTGALSVIGIGEIYGLRFIKPLTGLDNYSHSLTLGVDYKSFEENLNLIGADNAISTPIDYIPFMAQYNSTLNGDHSQTSFNVGLNFAFRGMGNEPEEFENKRFNSRPNYAYLTAGANYVQDLPMDMEFAGRISGQVAESPLISNEQFSMGGMQSVRGYFETQALADDGFTGSLELKSPRLAPLSLDYIDKLHALVFVDGGYGTIKEALPGNKNSFALASTGLGIQFQVWKYFSGILDLGIPLLDLNSVQTGHPKLHFSIASEF
jgi:hemolysin activation/secretion protein